MTIPNYIEDDNLSFAWARAIRPLMTGGPKEIAPLIVSIRKFDDGVPIEDAAVRSELDAGLERSNMQNCDTVANTIFPLSMWNADAPRAQLFDRFWRILPRLIKSSPMNRHGTYFQRLVEGGPPKHANQLDFVISNFLSRKRVRRSALQVAVYDAQRDLTSAAMRGFPCLQHVTFAPVDGNGLNLNAFYATQFAFERAYGNYLGLCRLGHFVAHELGRTLTRVTCFTGIMLRDGCPPAGSKRKLAKLVDIRAGGSR
jgi:hypothetical protein